MAELATIARPYAEALFKACAQADGAGLAAELRLLADVTADAQLRQFADNPKVSDAQVFEVINAVVKAPVSAAVTNLLRTMIENGRLAALPEVAAQFHALVNERAGVSDAVIHSAFPIDAAQLAEVVGALEKRFGRKLNPSVVIEPELIGGIRVVVGDEVLDTSVKARLQQMKVALTA
jgi:F-type H+-transporting ATPase subunit delta